MLYRRIPALVLVGLLVISLALVGPPVQAQSPAPTWRDTGLNATNLGRPVCFDATRPNVYLTTEENVGTVAYNWATGQRTVVNKRAFSVCDFNGNLFAGDLGGAWRFSTADPVGQAVAHQPTHAAQDGSPYLYTLAGPTHDQPLGHLWASSDSGLTWQERALPPGGSTESLALAKADGRVLYALTMDRTVSRYLPIPYAIYASTDAGATWEPRFAGETGGGFSDYGGPYLDVYPAPGGAGPVGTLALVQDPGYPGSSNQQTVLLSDDGARTFTPVGTLGLGTNVQLAQTQEGILNLSGGGYNLGLRRNGNPAWQPLSLPPLNPPISGLYAPLTVARDAPANAFIADGTALWYAPDGGHTWQALGTGDTTFLAAAPYLPLTLLGTKANRLQALDLPDAGRTLTAATADAGIPGGVYFAETGHNLSGIFQQYWTAHGGLARFGYPRTEPFREVDPADGRVYLTQYFERARLEYHPEFAGTPYAVELGLLGSQLTAARRAAGETPFAAVADPAAPGVIYFAPTGHTLRGPFRQTWETQGGLALYGYPISEEFPEVNPADGQTYTVQYFERARFEHHPAYAGTPFEVLLGLLGNTLLADKGWP